MTLHSNLLQNIKVEHTGKFPKKILKCHNIVKTCILHH